MKEHAVAIPKPQTEVLTVGDDAVGKRIQHSRHDAKTAPMTPAGAQSVSKKKAETPQPELPRSEYGIDQQTFIHAWMTAFTSGGTPDEVFAILAEVSRKQGLPPMPKPIILARAAKYRKEGMDLPKFKPGRPPASLDVKQANDLIQTYYKEPPGSVQAPPVPPPAAQAPPVDEEAAKAAIQRILGRK